MSEHTPGPWAVESDHDDIEGTVLVHGAADAPGLTPVALVYTADSFLCVEDDDRVGFEAECAGNANLIAAAPDLLGVVRSLITYDLAVHDEEQVSEHDLKQMWNALVVEARAALAKARGE